MDEYQKIKDYLAQKGYAGFDLEAQTERTARRVLLAGHDDGPPCQGTGKKPVEIEPKEREVGPVTKAVELIVKDLLAEQGKIIADLESREQALAKRCGELEIELAKSEKALGNTVDEREDAEQAMSQAYYLILGRSPEWSNHFGYTQALEDIDEAQKLLRVSLKSAEERESALAERCAELEAEQIALLTGLRNEFTRGEFSGDILQDYETFFEHHKSVEKRVKDLEATIEKEFSATSVMSLYDLILKEHPLYRRFIDGTPFENDCAAMAWTMVMRILKCNPAFTPTPPSGESKP